MKEIETFDIENKKQNNEEEKDNFMGRYEVDNFAQNDQFILQKDKNIKKNKIPIYYILFFALLLLLCVIITLIIELIKKEINYTTEKEPFLKPNISNHSYTRIKFKNHLELLLTQVNKDDKAGGTIIFNTGYLDRNYKLGYLKLAIYSLVTNEMEKTVKLRDYIGNFGLEVGQHYSYFTFTIINEGIMDYLKIFSKLTYFEDNDERFNNINIKQRLKALRIKLLLEKNNLNKREKHLLEYLIYGYKDDEGNDIYPEGNKIIQDEDKINYDLIKNIMKSLLNPSKMKIIINSRYKMSLIKKKFLKYFNNIANVENIAINNSLNENDNNNNKLSTNKMIYMQIRNYETNYIKINYYIYREDNDYETFFINSGYLNYIKYILEMTNNISLYYQLTNSNNSNIKSLSCDYEVILINKIKFSITIYLNTYSYEHLEEIIKKTYSYMNKIINYVKSLNKKEDFKLIYELYKIFGQNFSFTEDLHDSTPNNPKKGINLYCKNQREYFLRDVWLPKSFNVNNLKNYTNQIIPNNSVLIIGLNNYTLNETKNIFNNSNSSLSALFNDIELCTEYDFNYSIKDLNDNLTKDFDDDKNNIIFDDYKNLFISNYSGSSKLVEYPEDNNNISNSTPIGEKNYSLIKFYFKRDTSFRIPKVYFTFNFFHPFMRAQDDNKDIKDRRFFEIMLYLAYINREIKLNLADAIRAGNIFSIGFNQNLFYVDVFCYEDVSKKILNIIQKIIMEFDPNRFNDIKLFTIYRDATLEDYLNFESTNINVKLRMAFYENLYECEKNEKCDKVEKVGIYNYYNFPRIKYLKKEIEDNEIEYFKLITSFVMHGHIYGYYEYDDAEDIYNLFTQNKTYTNHFKEALYYSNISTTLGIETEDDFVTWMNSKNNLKKNKTINYINCNKNVKRYRFLYWSQYNLIDRVITNVFDKILNEATEEEEEYRNTIKSFIFSQKNLYFQYNILSEDYIDESKFYEIVINITHSKEDNYTTNIDTIGSRLYYLIRNIVNDIKSAREDLKKSAIARINSNTLNNLDYDSLNIFDDKNIKDINISDFYYYFSSIYKTNFHMDFNCIE